MRTVEEMIRLSESERPYEWLNFDVTWRSWEGRGAPSMDLITKDGKKLKRTNGIIPINPDMYPVFAIHLDATGFSCAWDLLVPLVLHWEDVTVSGTAIRIFELKPEPVDIDLARSEYVAVGDRVDLLRSAALVSEVLPPVMVAAQGSPYETFLRGDLVQRLTDCGVLDAFEPEVIGRVRL